MMNTRKTIEIQAVRYDEDGQEAGGVNIYWSKGSRVVLVQEWEYRCAGNTYSQISPDPIGEQGLLEYFLASWKWKTEPGEDPVEYIVKSVNENYC